MSAGRGRAFRWWRQRFAAWARIRGSRHEIEITHNVKDYMKNIHAGINQSKLVAQSQVAATEEVLTTLEVLADISVRLRQLSDSLCRCKAAAFPT